MRRTIVVVGLLWVALIVASFAWNWRDLRQQQRKVALQTARSFFEQVVMSRAWNAAHGGVYVPVTKTTQPNPYLEDPLRDVETTDGLKLTKVNPAFMTRQVAEITKRDEGVWVHITSLKPIRPGNRPTSREARALNQFRDGTKEVGEVVDDDGKRSFFFMAPLCTDASCLRCHAKQGYKEGDIRGGISIRLPFLAPASIASLAIGHGLIGGLGLLGILVFGARMSRAYETMRYESANDVLTGLPNRRSFLERIMTELGRTRRRRAPLAVIMGDIDRFKLYNDTFGHPAGDSCLRWVGQAIQGVLRRPGDFCARYGGEEFVAVLPDVDGEGAMFVAERIRCAVEALAIPHAEGASAKVVTLSLGVAVSEASQRTCQELVHQADVALYMAKRNGRNRAERFSVDVPGVAEHADSCCAGTA